MYVRKIRSVHSIGFPLHNDFLMIYHLMIGLVISLICCLKIYGWRCLQDQFNILG